MTPAQPILFYSGLATKPALENVIIPAFIHANGTPVIVEYSPTSVFVEKMARGSRPDVILGTSQALRVLADGGSILASSVQPVARSGIGIAVPPGQLLPQLLAVDDLITALSSARSVAYSASGASGIYFAGLLKRLGIADEVNSRATILPEGFTATALLDGRADVAVQQLSELSAVPGVQIASLPDGAQSFTEFSAAVATRAHQEAQRFADSLSTEEAVAAYVHTGLQTVSR